MMLLLDPALFLTEKPDQLSYEEDTLLTRLVDDAVRLCRQPGHRVLAAGGYWSKLQQELVRPLERVGSPRLKAGLDALRAHARPLVLPEPPASGKARMWGALQLFGWLRLGNDWFKVMEHVLLRCALLDEPVSLLVRLFEGRNQTTHAVGHSQLLEKTRWRLYVQVPGRPLCTLPCLRNPRNLAVDWTQRFDERLPAQSDGARFPFCPPEKWWRRHVEAFRTVKSKPAWVDKRGNGWARPATGGGHHWDVFIADPRLADSIGLDQLNIVQWEVRPEGSIGHIHHVPSEKRGRLRDTAGWTCD